MKRGDNLENGRILFETEAQLARAVARGDRVAVETLYVLIKPLILRAVRRYRWLQTEERKDMAQEVTVWIIDGARQDCARFRPEQAGLRTYYQKIISRKCSKYAEKVTKERPMQAGVAESSTDLAELTHDVRSHGDLELERAVRLIPDWLDRLGEDDRFLVERRILGPLSSRQAAETLGVTVTVVDQRVRRLRTRLKSFLNEKGCAVFVALFALVVSGRLPGIRGDGPGRTDRGVEVFRTADGDHLSGVGSRSCGACGSLE